MLRALRVGIRAPRRPGLVYRAALPALTALLLIGAGPGAGGAAAQGTDPAAAQRTGPGPAQRTGSAAGQGTDPTAAQWLIRAAALEARALRLARPGTSQPAALPFGSSRPATSRLGPSIMQLRLDNDVLAGTDRGYTAGAALSWVSAERRGGAAIGWLGWLPGATRPDAAVTLRLTAGQSLYTPADLRESELLTEDRPYAGLLHLSGGATVRRPGHEDEIELALGVVGPAAGGEQFQRAVHEIFHFPIPQGWKHQLQNEPIVQLSVERRWKALARGDAGAFAMDLIPHAGAGAGNLALYATAGFRGRVGWNLPADFGAGSIRPGGRRWGGSERPAETFSIHLYVGADGNAIVRDLLLDGNTFRESHRVERNPWTLDGIVGIEFSRGRFGLAYEHIHWTRRFSSEMREQSFSSLTLRVR